MFSRVEHHKNKNRKKKKKKKNHIQTLELFITELNVYSSVTLKDSAVVDL